MNIKKSNLIQILEYSLLAFGIPLLCIFLCRLTRIKENGALSLILYGIEGASPTLAVIILIFVQNNKCNLTEYLTKRTFQRETIREEVGNDGKPREIKGFGEFHREKMKHL